MIRFARGSFRMVRYLLSAWTPGGYLPSWDSLTVYDGLSHQLANEHADEFTRRRALKEQRERERSDAA